MNEEQNINQLPNDWKWVKLGEVAKVKGGKRLPKGEPYAGQKTDFPYLRVVDFENMSINQTDLKYLNEHTQKQIKNYTITSDDLYMSIAGTIGRVGMIPATLSGSNLTENAAKITDIKEFEIKYLSLLLNSHTIQSQISEKTIATTQPKLALYRIEKLCMPLPPKKLQQQIISKIEELFSEIEKGIEEINIVQQQLKVYRQAVLKWAFEGKLTNKDISNGKLPASWKLLAIEEIGKVKGGKRLPKGELYSKEQTAFPYLRVTDFENQSINQTKLKFLQPATQAAIKNYTISKNDVFISIAGTIGVTGTIPENLDGGNLTENAAKITDLKSTYNKYLSRFLASTNGQAQIKENTKTTTQPKLSLYRIEKIKIPLPPFEEQQQIVQEIESRLSVCDKIEETITNSLKQAEALRQSILKKAFEGKLI